MEVSERVCVSECIHKDKKHIFLKNQTNEKTNEQNLKMSACMGSEEKIKSLLSLFSVRLLW